MVPHGGSTVVACGVYSVCRMNRVEIYFGEWLRDRQEIYQTRLTSFVAARDVFHVFSKNHHVILFILLGLLLYLPTKLHFYQSKNFLRSPFLPSEKKNFSMLLILN